METHIFDVDHTILKNATGIAFIKEGLKRGYFSLFSLMRVPYLVLSYRKGTFNQDLLNQHVPFSRKVTMEELKELGGYCFEKYCKKNISLSIKKRIDEKQKEGQMIILATSSFDFLVKPLADYLSISSIVSSKLQLSEDSRSGFIDGDPAFGQFKKAKVVDLLHFSNIELKDCWFYSDSIHDLPLFEMVKHPVAVNPDQRIKKIAKRRAWEIIYF